MNIWIAMHDPTESRTSAKSSRWPYLREIQPLARPRNSPCSVAFTSSVAYPCFVAGPAAWLRSEWLSCSRSINQNTIHLRRSYFIPTPEFPFSLVVLAFVDAQGERKREPSPIDLHAVHLHRLFRWDNRRRVAGETENISYGVSFGFSRDIIMEIKWELSLERGSYSNGRSSLRNFKSPIHEEPSDSVIYISRATVR
ncbi:uncharacterized protein LOC124928597 isoform X2 [Impatiens glandulifera]|uniref:uncharacterized protein LOC124928597 isoform X2 n=1 Tax=Impatiens glandulifera TaxID=253017 RepID=UPI001FB0BBF2|nr:uncharacterized protein LOC124928597 isoform X2 [Impatiens glandulifera]